MKNPTIWIFGDSYSELKHHYDKAWPKRLSNKYKVKNFSHQGTGFDWSIEQIGMNFKPNADDILMCWISDPYRQNWQIWQDKSEQTVSKWLATGGGYHLDKKLAIQYKMKYDKYKDFFKNFIYAQKDNWEQIEYQKQLGYVNALAPRVKKILVFTCFNTIDTKDMILNDNVTVAPWCMTDFQSPEGNLPMNHLPEEKHDRLYNYLIDWIENNKPIPKNFDA